MKLNLIKSIFLIFLLAFYSCDLNSNKDADTREGLSRVVDDEMWVKYLHSDMWIGHFKGENGVKQRLSLKFNKNSETVTHYIKDVPEERNLEDILMSLFTSSVFTDFYNEYTNEPGKKTIFKIKIEKDFLYFADEDSDIYDKFARIQKEYNMGNKFLNLYPIKNGIEDNTFISLFSLPNTPDEESIAVDNIELGEYLHKSTYNSISEGYFLFWILLLGNDFYMQHTFATMPEIQMINGEPVIVSTEKKQLIVDINFDTDKSLIEFSMSINEREFHTSSEFFKIEKNILYIHKQLIWYGAFVIDYSDKDMLLLTPTLVIDPNYSPGPMFFKRK